ncbi:MAG: hypothetical protein ACK5Z5_04900 [Neisseriaceae bacterium]
MQITLVWTYINNSTLQSNIFFDKRYYKITYNHNKTKYKLEFCEQDICEEKNIIVSDLEEAKHLAIIHATSLIYHFTLNPEDIESLHKTIH